MSVLYLYIGNVPDMNVPKFLGVSEKTYIAVKKKFNNIAEILVEIFELIGGDGIIVEMDETVISRRGVIASPTAFDETQSNTSDLVWLVGDIIRGNITRFFLIILENRRPETLRNHIERYTLQNML